MDTRWAVYRCACGNARGNVGFEKEKMSKLIARCLRQKKVERCEVTDVYDIARGVKVVSRWIARRLLICTAGAVRKKAEGLERKR